MTAMPIAPGTVLVSSWGYDQTNVNFYVVVSATRKTVTVRELRSEVIDGDRVVPVAGSENGPAMRRKINIRAMSPVLCSDRPSVRIDGAFAYPWTGRAERQTEAMAGH